MAVWLTSDSSKDEVEGHPLLATAPGPAFRCKLATCAAERKKRRSFPACSSGASSAYHELVWRRGAAAAAASDSEACVLLPAAFLD